MAEDSTEGNNIAKEEMDRSGFSAFDSVTNQIDHVL
jgi:hypothetical protein